MKTPEIEKKRKKRWPKSHPGFKLNPTSLGSFFFSSIFVMLPNWGSYQRRFSQIWLDRVSSFLFFFFFPLPSQFCGMKNVVGFPFKISKISRIYT